MASTPSSVVGQRNCIFVTAHSIGHGAGAQTMVSERGGEVYSSGLELSGFGRWGMVSQESSDSAREILAIQHSHYCVTCLQLHPVVPSFPPTTIRRVGSNTTATTLRCLGTPCFFLLPRLLPFLPPPPIPCPPLPNPINCNCQPLFSIPEKFGPKLPTKTHALRSSWRRWVSPFLKEAAF